MSHVTHFAMNTRFSALSGFHDDNEKGQPNISSSSAGATASSCA